MTDYRVLIDNPDIDAIMVSATPETTHYPMALEALQAGKHVLLEKPIALTLAEADHLIEEAESRDLKFAIGYSQRFNPKQALVKRSFEDGTLGQPISVLITRHVTRQLGDKIGGRIKLSPAAMEATHDIDFALWCLEPVRPVRVYAQGVDRVQKPKYDVPDLMSILITMDDGTLVTISAGWVLPPAYRNYSQMWMEFVGTNGALMLDDTHRDVVMSTMDGGTVFPLSTMPGEAVLHAYAGPMERETLHFIDAVALDRDVLVTGAAGAATPWRSTWPPISLASATQPVSHSARRRRDRRGAHGVGARRDSPALRASSTRTATTSPPRSSATLAEARPSTA